MDTNIYSEFIVNKNSTTITKENINILENIKNLNNLEFYSIAKSNHLEIIEKDFDGKKLVEEVFSVLSHNEAGFFSFSDIPSHLDKDPINRSLGWGKETIWFDSISIIYTQLLESRKIRSKGFKRSQLFKTLLSEISKKLISPEIIIDEKEKNCLLEKIRQCLKISSVSSHKKATNTPIKKYETNAINDILQFLCLNNSLFITNDKEAFMEACYAFLSDEGSYSRPIYLEQIKKA